MPEVGSLFVRLRADASEFEAALKGASAKLKSVGDAMQDIGRQFSIVGAGVAALGGLAAKAAIDYESAFAGVRKTVDATEEELQAISQGIRQMAQEIPAAATEIAAVAEAAGQLGIETDNILLFTRTMIDLGEATNLTGEQAATALARLANITQMPQEQFDRLGSTIVALGNNLATTEAEIVEMALRIAGAGAQIGLTEAQILAFAGALSSVGIEAQAGGSAISRVMIMIANAVASGGEQLAGFAQVAGMTVAEFQQAFKEDAAGAVITFIEGLGRMSEAGENVFAVLDELGLSEIRVRDALLRAAGAGDLFRNSQELATDAWEKNVALSNEAAERYATTASQLRIMRNQLMDVAISLGDILVPIIMNAVRPAFEAFVGLLQRGIAWFGSLSERTQTIAVAIGAFVVAIGPALIGLGTMLEVLGAVASSLAVLVSPIGLVIAAVAALGVAFATNWGGIRDAVIPVVTAIGDWLGRLANVLTGQFQPALAAVSGFLSSVWRGDLEGAREALGEFWDALGNVDWGAIGQVLRDGLTAALQGLTDLGQAALGLATNLLSALGDALGSVDWSGVATIIVGALGSAISTVVGIGETILSWIGDQLGQVDWSEVGTAVLDGISTAVSTLAQTAGELGGHILAWVQTNVESVDWAQVGQTILDGIGSALSQLREFETIDTLVSALERLADVVERLAPLAGGIAAVVGAFLLFGQVSGIITAVTTTVSTLSAIVVGLASAIGLVGGPVSMLIALFNPLTAILAGVAAAVGLVAAAFIGNWFGIRDAVMGAVGAIVGILGEMWNNLTANAGPLLEQLRALWAALGPAIDVAKTGLTAIAAVVGGVLVAALGLVMGAIGGLVGALSGALPGAIKVATGVVQALTGAIQVVTAVVGGMVKLIVAIFTGDWRAAWEAAKGIVTGFAEGVGTIISGLFNAVTGAFEALVGAVVGAISGFVKTIIGFFQGLYHALVGGSIIPDMVNGIISWISQLPGKVLSIISELVVSVLSRMAEFAGDMLAKGGELIGNVADGMLSMLSTAVGAINDIVDAVLEVVSDAGEWLWDTGVNVVTGLWNGIKSMAAWIKDRVTGFVKDVIPGPIRKALGIESPSRVTAEFGRELVRGFVVGMEDGELELTKASADLAKSVVGAMRDVFALAKSLAGLAPDALDIAVEYLEYLPWLGRQLLIQMAKGRDLFEGPVLEEIEKLASAVSATFRAIGDVIGVAQELAGRDPWDLDIAVEYLEYLPWLGRAMLTQFVEGVSLFAGPVLEGAEKLASAVSAAFGAAGDALSFLGAAGELDPLDLARDLSGTMARINDLAIVAVAGLAELADRFGTEAVEAGEKAGAAVQGAFGGLLTGIEYVTTAAGLNPRRMGERLNQVTDLLHDQVARAMERMADLTALIGPARLAEIKAAAEGITAIFAALTQALDLSERLGARRGTRAADDALAGLVRFAGRAVETFAATFVDEGPAMEAAGVSLIERLETGIARQAESLLSLVRAIAQEVGATLASVGLAPGGVVVSPPSLEGMTTGSAQRFERQLQQLTAQLAGGGAAGAAAGMPEGVYVGQIVVPVDIGGQRFETVILDVVNGQLRRVL